MNNYTYDVIVACERTYDDLPEAICYKNYKNYCILEKKVV